MFLIFIECLRATDFTVGTHHIVDRNSGELTLSGLGREMPVMAKRSNIWRDPSENPTVTFVNNKTGFTIMIGDSSKLCTLGQNRLRLCPAYSPTPNDGDDFRLVIGGRGTSIRNKRSCLKIKQADYRKNIQEVKLVPCKDGGYSFFDIKSTTDAGAGDPNPSKYNPFNFFKNPFNF